MESSLSSFNHIIFDKLSKRAASSYLLDYVTKEYEAIISCPPVINTLVIKQESYKRMKPNCYNNNDSGLPSPPLSSPEETRSYPRAVECPPTPPDNQPTLTLRSYVESVVKKSRIDTGTLLVSLSYARRLRQKLLSTSKGMECTHHRIFLATLIIASKYIHDSALKNKYWVGYAQMFSASEINLMEKQLLQLLEYNLEIKSEEYNLIIDDVVRVYLQHKASRRFSCQDNTLNRPTAPPLFS